MSEPYTFTFGKHKGEAITAVPDDYLVWMVGEMTDKPHLRKKAAQELTRRGVKFTMPADLSDLGIDAVSSIEAGDTINRPRPEEPKTVIELADDMVNSFSRDVELLKDFVRRPNQDLGILEWLSDLAKETIRYGTKLNGTAGDGETHYLLGRYGIMTVRQGNLLTIKDIWHRNEDQAVAS